MSDQERRDEIEVKFVLRGLPPAHIIGNGKLVRVGYLFVGKFEMRLRINRAGKFIISAKTDGDLRRKEWEEEIPEWVFNGFWEKTEGRRFTRTQYIIINHDGSEIYVGHHHDHLEPLITMEQEFDTEEDARNFSLPEWAVALDAHDVTFDHHYKGQFLAQHGLPHDYGSWWPR